jgi:uncharacterized membrane protein required for colicin V production
MALASLNVLDYLLLFLLFLGALIGLIRGPMPQIISLASIWLGLLAAVWLYGPLSNRILQGLGFSKIVADTLAFLILLIIAFNVIRLVVKTLTVPPEEKKRKTKRRKGQVGPSEEVGKSATSKYITGPLLAIGGLVLGIILMSVWLALILGVFQFTFQVNVTDVTGISVPGSGLINQLKSSALISYFNRILQLLVESVSFFVIDSIVGPGPNILESVINRVFPPSSG